MRKGRDHGNEMREHMKIISSLTKRCKPWQKFFPKGTFLHPVAVHDTGEVGIKLKYLSLVWRVQRPIGCRPSTVGGQARVAEGRRENQGKTSRKKKRQINVPTKKCRIAE